MLIRVRNIDFISTRQLVDLELSVQPTPAVHSLTGIAHMILAPYVEKPSYISLCRHLFLNLANFYLYVWLFANSKILL